ncbi:MAG: hypothetical protein V7603_4306 [Micromonosporaceae bacterium]
MAIDGYLAGLAAALRGPRRVKADLLAEARDSLYDAADAYQKMGLTAAAAQRRAVADFGDHAEIAPAYQAELAIAQGRRTALLIAAGLVGVYVCTSLAWSGYGGSGYGGSGYGGSGYGGWLTTGFRGLCLAGATVALLVWLGFGWGSRFVPDGVGLTRCLGRAALAFLALHGLAGLAVYLWRLASWPGAPSSPLVWVASAPMALAFGYATLCAWRCLSVTRLAVSRPA